MDDDDDDDDDDVLLLLLPLSSLRTSSAVTGPSGSMRMSSGPSCRKLKPRSAVSTFEHTERKALNKVRSTRE